MPRPLQPHRCAPTFAALTALTALTAAATLSGCGTLATVQGPQHMQRLTQPQPVTVTLGPKADMSSFTAQLNGQDVTTAFTTQDNTLRFADHRFTAAPQTLTLSLTDSSGKSRLDHSLTFHPPTLAVQGNVGQAPRSRVRLSETGTARVTVKLPAAPRQTTHVTLTPRAMEGDTAIALGSGQPGQPVTLTFPAGCRMVTLDAHAPTAGSATIELTAPGYAATRLPVEIRPAFADILGKGSDLRKVTPISGAQNEAGDSSPAAEASPSSDDSQAQAELYEAAPLAEVPTP